MKKTVLITGCSTGLGHAAAKLFAAQGWQVAATMRDISKAGDLLSLPNVAVFKLDVTDAQSIKTAVKQTTEKFGNIDVLVNNAGFGAFGPLETASDELIDRQIATNLTGVFNTIRAVLPMMRERRQGVIVNVASIGGLLTMPLNSIYHATKFAVVGLTEALFYELAPFGIQAKVVAPGGMATDFSGRSLSLTFDNDNHPYVDYVSSVMASFRTTMAGNTPRSQPEQVAQIIYKAATDGSKQIKYVAGEDAQAMLSERNTLGDDAYVHELSRRFEMA